MRVPAQCPRCREVNERRQSMREVGSEKRSHELDQKANGINPNCYQTRDPLKRG